MKDTLLLLGALIILGTITVLIIIVSTPAPSIDPVNNFIEFSDYKSNYRLHKDTQYRTERIEDSTGIYYFVYLWHEGNHLVVEYSDTVIDGQFTFAKHWKDSFILALKGE